MSRYRALLAVPLAIALATSACAKDPASGVIVALQTDMALPDDVTSVSLDVTDTSTGSVLQSIYGVIEGDNIRFPSTITVARGDSYNLASVTIRVVAYKGDKAQVLRSITTTLPETDFALLPVDLSYLDWGSASGSLSEASPTSVGAVLAPAGGKLGNPGAIKGALCPEGETSVYGECVPQVVDVKTLQKYSDSLVFGDNKCFDFQACFEKRRIFLGDGVASNVDGGCTIRLPQDVNLDRVNFAVQRKRPPTSAKAQKAMCKGADCFVVLNRDSAPSQGQKHIPKGAYYVDANDSQVLHLGTGLCSVLAAKADLLATVVAGYGCQPKTREAPLCSDGNGQANAPDPTVVPPAALVGPSVDEPVVDLGTSLGDFVLAAGKPVFVAEPDGVNIGGATPLLNISGASARLFVDPAGTTFLYGGYDAGFKQGAFAVVSPELGSLTLFSATGKDSLAVLDATILQGGANFLAYATGIPFGGTASPALVPSFYELTYDPAVKAIRAKEIAHSPGACSALAADGKDVYVSCGTTFQSKVGRFTPGSTEIVPFATVDGLVRSMVVDHPAGTLPTVYATVGGVTHSAIVRVDAASPATELGAVLNAAPFTLEALLQTAQRSLILDQDYLYFPVEGASADPLTRTDRILAIPKEGGDWQEIGKTTGPRPLRTVRADDNAIYWNTVRDGLVVLKSAPKCWKQPKKCL
jgi:hypothetical protein